MLIREYVILTINWQWSGGTVAVEQSRSVAQILASNGKGSIAVMPLIRWQIILAKLIETSTELLQSMFAASGGLARSKDVVASPPHTHRHLAQESGHFSRRCDVTPRGGTACVHYPFRNRTRPPPLSFTTLLTYQVSFLSPHLTHLSPSG